MTDRDRTVEREHTQLVAELMNAAHSRKQFPGLTGEPTTPGLPPTQPTTPETQTEPLEPAHGD